MPRKTKTPHKADLLITREQWLENAVHFLKDLFKANGFELPLVKVSCSWPGGGSARKRIGECWARKASAAGVNEIFISPRLAKPKEVLAVLVHELCHAVDDCASGHGKPFGKIARAVGLEGKLTATVASEGLDRHFDELLVKLGTFPHSELNTSIGRKKDTVRQLKCQCLDQNCGAIWRMTKQWVEMAVTGEGLHCPVCGGEGELA